MILTGLEIERQIKLGRINIEPFKTSRVNPNSYNVTLAPELYVYRDPILDMKKKGDLERIEIPESGLKLEPNKLYLGRTNEYTSTRDYVPLLEGRSSIGRLGLFIHVTAGFGDVGFSGYWTLEIACVQPIVIYPNIEIGQLYYHVPEGKKTYYKANAKYNYNNGVQGSKIYKELQCRE